MLVKLRGTSVLGQAVEVGEQVNLGFGRSRPGLGLPEEVVNQDFRVDLFLDVKRRGGDDQFRPIEDVFAAPDELGVEVPVASLERDLDGRFLLLPHQGLVLRSGEVLPLRVMPERGDRFAFGGCFLDRHRRESTANGREWTRMRGERGQAWAVDGEREARPPPAGIER
ncbi:MAG TPA: hypothetical protein P5525_03785 [Candidatus Paceibacterota bacterium]|nr:hypothetical protein [Candidatus Paceibacterota bacterium]